MAKQFNHLVEIDEKVKRLTIYRVFEDGRKELFTHVDIPDLASTKDEEKLRKFALQLGENLLIDSPIARRLLGL